MPPLENPRHERFAQELAGGKSQIEAYEAAGYKPSAPNACHLQAEHKVSQRVAELLAQRAIKAERATEKAVEKLALTKEWVIGRLMENAERALQRVPVLDNEGQPTGEYRYDGAVANRALELLGKHLGILIDRKEIGEPGEFDRLSDDDLRADLAERASRLGIAVPVRNGKGNGTSH